MKFFKSIDKAIEYYQNNEYVGNTHLAARNYERYDRMAEFITKDIDLDNTLAGKLVTRINPKNYTENAGSSELDVTIQKDSNYAYYKGTQSDLPLSNFKDGDQGYFIIKIEDQNNEFYYSELIYCDKCLLLGVRFSFIIEITELTTSGVRTIDVPIEGLTLEVDEFSFSGDSDSNGIVVFGIDELKRHAYRILAGEFDYDTGFNTGTFDWSQSESTVLVTEGGLSAGEDWAKNGVFE